MTATTQIHLAPSSISMQEMLSVVAIGRVSAGSGGDFHRDSISHAVASRVEVECSRRSSATMAARAMNGVRTLVRQFSANLLFPSFCHRSMFRWVLSASMWLAIQLGTRTLNILVAYDHRRCSMCISFCLRVIPIAPVNLG